MNLSKYSKIFYAAAFYNLFWGIINILFPKFFFDLIGMEYPNYLSLWKVVGMFVLVYAPPYFWAARNPEKHYLFILIGLLGKLFGPIGFVISYFNGDLPLNFGFTIILNDLIWLPAFILYLKEIARKKGLINMLLDN